MSRKYKHIIFDIDGTLLDTEHAILQSLKDTVNSLLHKDIPANNLKFALGIPGNVTLQKLGFTDTVTANLVWNTYLHNYKSSIKLFNGIQDLLHALKTKRYSLGIVTSKTRQEFSTDFSQPFKISGIFDTVICVEDSSLPKPFPEPLLAYLDAANTNPQDAIYIGDTIYYSQCARSAGIDFGLASWGNTTSQGIPADYIFKMPNDILLSL